MPRPNFPPAVLADRRQRALALLRTGISARQVAAAIGCHHTSVLRWRVDEQAGRVPPGDRHGTQGTKWSDDDRARARLKRRQKSVGTSLEATVANLRAALPVWVTERLVRRVALMMRTVPTRVAGVAILRWDTASLARAFGLQAMLPDKKDPDYKTRESKLLQLWPSAEALLEQQLRGLGFQQGGDQCWMAPPEEVWKTALRRAQKKGAWPTTAPPGT